MWKNLQLSQFPCHYGEKEWTSETMHRSTRSEQIDQKRALQTAKKARHHKSNGKTTLLFQIGYIGRVLPNIAGWRKLKTVLIQHAFWQALLSLYAFWNCLSSWGFSKESTTLKWYGKWGSFSGWWLFGELQEQSMMSDLKKVMAQAQKWRWVKLLTWATPQCVYSHTLRR